MQSPDPKIDGGFAFARQNGEIILDINPTATIFAIQALSMWDEGQQGSVSRPLGNTHLTRRIFANHRRHLMRPRNQMRRNRIPPDTRPALWNAGLHAP